MAKTPTITINRGTTYTLSGIYKEDGVAADITGAAIRFTVKPEEWDADADDSDATIAKSGSITDASAGTYAIALTDTDTYVDAGDYFFDIKIELADGTIHRLVEGNCIIDGSPTNRTS